MAIVVIGGHSRNVGKTSVVAGLIAKLPAYNWTAFKLTQFGHGRCSLNGKPCHCETADHAWAITEEKDTSGKTDSSRFLVSGAKHSFWVRTAQGKLQEAIPAIQRRLNDAENAILESNSILKFIQQMFISLCLIPPPKISKARPSNFLNEPTQCFFTAAELTNRSGRE